MNASIASLEEELESSRDRGERWRMQLDATAQELQKTAQESVTTPQLNMNIIHTDTVWFRRNQKRPWWFGPFELVQIQTSEYWC